MSSTLQQALDSLKAGRPAATERLHSLIRIASVSNAPGFDTELDAAADWVAEQLREIGLSEVRLHRVGATDLADAAGTTEATKARRPQLVLASDDSAGPDAELVLFYGHYDVQEEGPAWSICTAFDPKSVNGRTYGRGAGDNKGPVIAFMEALRAWKVGTGRLPVRVRIILEGQEESGSGAIIDFLASELGKAFIEGASTVLVADTLASPDGRPSITFGLRGLSYFHLEVLGPGTQTHSGHGGGNIQDPGGALAHLLASIWDPRTRTFLVPGLVDRVTPLSEREGQLLDTSPITAESMQKESGGVPALIQVPNSTPARQMGALPAFTVHTLITGAPKPGATPTNIPTSAEANFSIRLVPDQNPEEIGRLVEEHLNGVVREVLHDTVRIKLTMEKGSFPVRFSPESPQIEAAAQAMTSAWGTAPAFLLAGGSIPIVGHFQALLPAPIILWGGTNADSSFHGPNENLTDHNFFASAEGMVHLLYNLSTVSRAA
ncbi:MAG: M20/M25/M40 family metallo-hydrolase [Deltaproteobacteria bacterium]|nr:M20/M25/M40 family metallo-hydrolase [Deltaproteobacteria bacterium]